MNLRKKLKIKMGKAKGDLIVDGKKIRFKMEKSNSNKPDKDDKKIEKEIRDLKRDHRDLEEIVFEDEIFEDLPFIAALASISKKENLKSVLRVSSSFFPEERKDIYINSFILDNLDEVLMI
jgi:hypothetical protein